MIVTSAPGEGKMPFWHRTPSGGRSSLGAIGAFLREVEPMKPAAAIERLRNDHAMDELLGEEPRGILSSSAR